MSFFLNKDGAAIVRALIGTIQKNKDYLSEIDGAIGDGDHGVNMEKGFSLCESRVDWSTATFFDAARTLSRVLMMEIGGSMGPIYGTFFGEMAKVAKGKENLSPEDFSEMLHGAISGIEGPDWGTRPCWIRSSPRSMLLTQLWRRSAILKWPCPLCPKLRKRGGKRPGIWWQKLGGPAVWGSAPAASMTQGRPRAAFC